MVQLSHPYMTTGKTITFTIWTLFGKVMSLLFNMLSRFIIAFLPRNKLLLISWLQSPSAVILEPKKIKSVTVWGINIQFSNRCPKSFLHFHMRMGDNGEKSHRILKNSMYLNKNKCKCGSLISPTPPLTPTSGISISVSLVGLLIFT